MAATKWLLAFLPNTKLTTHLIFLLSQKRSMPSYCPYKSNCDVVIRCICVQRNIFVWHLRHSIWIKKRLTDCNRNLPYNLQVTVQKLNTQCHFCWQLQLCMIDLQSRLNFHWGVVLLFIFSEWVDLLSLREDHYFGWCRRIIRNLSRIFVAYNTNLLTKSYVYILIQNSTTFSKQIWKYYFPVLLVSNILKSLLCQFIFPGTYAYM